jgi:hypothetical protein
MITDDACFNSIRDKLDAPPLTILQRKVGNVGSVILEAESLSRDRGKRKRDDDTRGSDDSTENDDKLA